MRDHIEKNYIELEAGRIYGLPIANGVLRFDICKDENYPGIDIEFIPNNPVECVSRPRVLIKAPIDPDTQIIEEFKALKKNERKCEDCAGCTNWKCDCANIRAKAIDDFTEKVSLEISESII